MSKAAIVTARLSAETAEALQAFASKRDRSRAWVLTQAVNRFLAEEAELDAFIEEGRRSIRDEGGPTHEQAMAEIARCQAARPDRRRDISAGRHVPCAM